MLSWYYEFLLQRKGIYLVTKKDKTAFETTLNHGRQVIWNV